MEKKIAYESAKLMIDKDINKIDYIYSSPFTRCIPAPKGAVTVPGGLYTNCTIYFQIYLQNN